MTDMTAATVRRRLKAYREGHRQSFDALYADMRMVLKRDTPSPRTLSRFEQGTHQPHRYTIADIAEYLDVVKSRDAAA